MTLAGPKAWTVEEVIALCEKYADAEADVSLQDSHFFCNVKDLCSFPCKPVSLATPLLRR